MCEHEEDVVANRMTVHRPGETAVMHPTGPVFSGQIEAFRLVTGHGEWTRVSLVTFANNATTTPHVHTMDQLLLIVSGEGLVTSDGVEYIVQPGDAIFTPAGVAHTHGASPRLGHMSHFVVMGEGDTEAV